MPSQASVWLWCDDEEGALGLKHLGLPVQGWANARVVGLAQRRELIKALACEDILRRILVIDIKLESRELFHANDYMMNSFIHKPIDLPPRFISKYQLVEYETNWAFESDGFDGLEQWISILE